MILTVNIAMLIRMKKVEENFQNDDDNSSLLVGYLKTSDTIKRRTK